MKNKIRDSPFADAQRIFALGLYFDTIKCMGEALAFIGEKADVKNRYQDIRARMDLLMVVYICSREVFTASQPPFTSLMYVKGRMSVLLGGDDSNKIFVGTLRTCMKLDYIHRNKKMTNIYRIVDNVTTLVNKDMKGHSLIGLTPKGSELVEYFRMKYNDMLSNYGMNDELPKTPKIKLPGHSTKRVRYNYMSFYFLKVGHKVMVKMASQYREGTVVSKERSGIEIKLAPDIKTIYLTYKFLRNMRKTRNVLFKPKQSPLKPKQQPHANNPKEESGSPGDTGTGISLSHTPDNDGIQDQIGPIPA